MPYLRSWILYCVSHILFIGVWGALIEIPEKKGFPPTLGYIVWAAGMAPVALAALRLNKLKLNKSKKVIGFGMALGLLGAGGQMMLFFLLKVLPAYLVFPVLSLTPMVTIFLAVIFLRENSGVMGWVGIFLAVLSIVILSYQFPEKTAGGASFTNLILLALIPMAAWGVQGFLMRFANAFCDAENIFFYMAISAIMFIPVALFLTDFNTPINWTSGVFAFFIQLLNAIGALCLVYSFRFGKAILVAPLTTALSPVLTVGLSLLIYNTVPDFRTLVGILLALIAALVISITENKNIQGNP